MAITQIPNGRQQFFNADGPLVGGRVYTFVPGTTVAKTTYVDNTGTSTNTNPITLDAIGSAAIWGNGAYRQQVFDSLGNEVWDAVTGGSGIIFGIVVSDYPTVQLADAAAAAADQALIAPAEREDVLFKQDALDALYEAADGYPYFVQAYGKVTWDVATDSPVTAKDVAVASPQAEAELAVGFFGSRYERATPAERDYMRAMAQLGDDPVQTAQVADELGRKPSSVSPARDGLIKKGLIYSSERGLIAFTVPHFGRFLRAQPV